MIRNTLNGSEAARRALKAASFTPAEVVNKIRIDYNLSKISWMEQHRIRDRSGSSPTDLAPSLALIAGAFPTVHSARNSCLRVTSCNRFSSPVRGKDLLIRVAAG
jgi:hypothetical protein